MGSILETAAGSTRLPLADPSVLIFAVFRRPKLSQSHYAVSVNSEPVPDTHGINKSMISGHSGGSSKPVVASFPTSLKVPVFSKRKTRDVQTPCPGKCEKKLQNQISKISKELEKSSTKKPQEGTSKVIAGDNSAAVSLLQKKRVYAEPETSLQRKLQEADCKSVGELPTSLLKKKKTSDCFQPTIQKFQVLPTASNGAPNALIKPSSCVKQPPLVPMGSIKDQVPLKIEDHSAQKSATSSEKKSARGEKKRANTAIDSETNKKKVLSKHAQGKLSDLTVPELKLFLSENKTKVSGKKEELVQRVMLLLSSKKP